MEKNREDEWCAIEADGLTEEQDAYILSIIDGLYEKTKSDFVFVYETARSIFDYVFRIRLDDKRITKPLNAKQVRNIKTLAMLTVVRELNFDLHDGWIKKTYKSNTSEN